MGCDIHMAYQKVSKQQKRENKLSEIFDNDAEKLEQKWEFIKDGPTDGGYDYQFSSEDRNYYWFGRMSEVRGSGPRITEPGFPDDINFEDANEYRWLGEHSFSHVYLSRLLQEQWDEEDKHMMRKFINIEIPRMVKYCEDNGLRPDEFRILIGYDS
jgi:hypothetical protein